MIQSKVPLLGLTLRNVHKFVHLSNHLTHPVTIPLNYMGEDTIIPETGQPFPIFARTFIMDFLIGMSLWHQFYEGLGLAFPIQLYHNPYGGHCDSSRPSQPHGSAEQHRPQNNQGQHPSRGRGGPHGHKPFKGM